MMTSCAQLRVTGVEGADNRARSLRGSFDGLGTVKLEKIEVQKALLIQSVIQWLIAEDVNMC